MTGVSNMRFFSLVQRELREYRFSLLYSPFITAAVLAVLMVASVVIGNRFSSIGDSMVDAILAADDTSIDVSRSLDSRSDFSYSVTIEGDAATAPWDFGRNWTYEPEGGSQRDREISAAISVATRDGAERVGEELNAVLRALHGVFILVLLATTANYLLGTLFEDRKDQSILFWRSMPLSEREVVFSKFVTAIIVAPIIYIAASLVLQLFYLAMMTVLLWGRTESPVALVFESTDVTSLMLDPVSGWFMTMLFAAPAYAWLLLASSAARRSPFMLSVVPIAALVILERLFLGSANVWGAVQAHLPRPFDEHPLRTYFFGTPLQGVDLLSLVSGLIFTVFALAAAVWLRKHRWEIN